MSVTSKILTGAEDTMAIVSNITFYTHNNLPTLPNIMMKAQNIIQCGHNIKKAVTKRQ